MELFTLLKPENEDVHITIVSMTSETDIYIDKEWKMEISGVQFIVNENKSEQLRVSMVGIGFCDPECIFNREIYKEERSFYHDGIRYAEEDAVFDFTKTDDNTLRYIAGLYGEMTAKLEKEDVNDLINRIWKTGREKLPEESIVDKIIKERQLVKEHIENAIIQKIDKSNLMTDMKEDLKKYYFLFHDMEMMSEGIRPSIIGAVYDYIVFNYTDNIRKIWEDSTDKKSVEKMFELVSGISFTDCILSHEEEFDR